MYMENIKKIIIFFLAISAMLLNYKVSYVYKSEDLFEEMLKVSEGQTIENGVRTRFSSREDGQEITEKLVGKIIVNQDTKVKSYRNKENFYIDFIDRKLEGSISVANYKDESIVTIDIIYRGSSNELDNIKNEVEFIIAPVSQSKKVYYEYLKAKLPDKDLSNLNKELITLLKNIGAINISSLELNSGLSTCAYTSKYKPKSNNGELMDLNFALGSYTSGKYLIIGTPEIITAY